MKFNLTWQDFMRAPENKALKESKGIHACKQKFIQEQNKMQWHDPVMLTENGAAADPTAFAAAGAGGGSTDFITGHLAQVSTHEVIGGATIHAKSQSFDVPAVGAATNPYFFDVEAYDGSTDFTQNHVQSMKKFRFFIVTASNISATIPSGIDGVVTASTVNANVQLNAPNGTAAGFSLYTASLNLQFQHGIANQVATAPIVGFANTIAPSTLFSAVTSSDGSGQQLIITNVNKASVVDIVKTTSAVYTGTSSISTTTAGLSTFHSDQGAQIFDGDEAPYNFIPHKLDTSS